MVPFDLLVDFNKRNFYRLLIATHVWPPVPSNLDDTAIHLLLNSNCNCGRSGWPNRCIIITRDIYPQRIFHALFQTLFGDYIGDTRLVSARRFPVLGCLAGVTSKIILVGLKRLWKCKRYAYYNSLFKSLNATSFGNRKLAQNICFLGLTSLTL